MPDQIDPFEVPSPSEVPLGRAPLVRVLAQLRFPEVLTVEQRDAVAPFQTAIAESYPVLRIEQIPVFQSSPPFQIRPQTVWRFHDRSGAWRVSLASTFLALETKHYTSRSDFVERLGRIAEAMVTHIGPSQVDRIGLRYVDLVTGSELEDIANLVRPEVRGIVGSSFAHRAQHALTEVLLDVDGSQLLARWGVLPKGATFDEAVLEPIQERSWVLDLDTFRTSVMDFDSKLIAEEARRCADLCYRFFRWAVKDQFLATYGAKL